jgi:[ribosomal protein S5]-alanine N-acetyltransferase
MNTPLGAHAIVGLIPEVIATDRLELRRPTLSDAHLIFEYAADPEVTRWMDWQAHRSIDTVVEYIQTCTALWDSGEEYTWIMTLRATKVSIGGISIRFRGHMADFGYVLHRQYWGQGLATEAAAATVRLASSVQGIHRIWATCDTENLSAARVLEKAGLSQEGTLRRWAVRPNISQEPRDAFVYSKIFDTPRP